ncbi:MAG TPA: SCO family protein [Pyrinomonadaceae bacterium]|nr:SCO family protein [Pyrinomonadaceae bacterium]
MKLKSLEATSFIFLFTFLSLSSTLFAQNPPPSASQNQESKSSSDGAASYLRNYVLVTQDEKPVHLYEDLLKGKIVLINFFFTTCQGICPRMTANLAKVQGLLSDHVGREVLMISISVDPVTDTPQALKKYSERFKAQPGWYFLTGKKENVDLVRSKFGTYVEDKQAHTSLLIIGNVATGEWMKANAMLNPTEIASAVIKLLDSKKK